MAVIRLKTIGIIHSPHKDTSGVPIQPAFAKGIPGWAEIFSEYREGLKDLEGFSHILLLYYCHLAKPSSLLVKPYLDTEKRGVFATRSPSRPNPVGLSLVRLLKIDGNRLELSDLDIVDSTPLLDIKPYIPAFDAGEEVRTGWITEKLEFRKHKE